MPSHAEKNQTEIKNYYCIIDPEERLSENEKAEEERKVLANIPGLRFYRLPRRSKERPADRAREARTECARYRP